MNTSNAPARILIVDDAAALRAALRAFFSNEGYQVVGEAASGTGVVEAVLKLQPDIVCLDYQLPGCNGMELLRTIHTTWPQIAVVMITGSVDARVESEAAECGAAGFIRKPFTQARIAQEIRQVVHVQTLQRQHQQNKILTREEARATAVVVDDSATMRQLLSAILNHGGIHVAGDASDGCQAIELVKRCKPDLVCLDMEMPIMNGLEALPGIKAAHPAAKVLMITGKAGREAVMEAARLGASGYLLKPFEPDRVLEALNKLLG